MTGQKILWWLSDLVVGNSVRVLFRLRVRGREHLPPRGPLVLVANHASFLDPLLLGTALRRPCRFVARSSLERIPVLGAWMRAVGVVFVQRGAPRKEPLDRTVDLLRRGERLALFPEGTRSRTGRMGPFRRGVLLLLKKTGATVVPVGIRGSFHAYPPGRRLPRLLRRCEVRFGEPLPAEEVLAADGLEELQRRVARLAGDAAAAEDVEEAIRTRNASMPRSGAGASARQPRAATSSAHGAPERRS